MSSSWQQQQRYMTKNHILFFVFWWMFSKLSSFGSVGGVFIKYFAPPAQHTFTQAKQQKKNFSFPHTTAIIKLSLLHWTKKKLTNSEKKIFTTSKLFLFLPLFLLLIFSKNGNFMCCKFTSSDKEFITLANSWTLLGSTLDLPSFACLLLRCMVHWGRSKNAHLLKEVKNDAQKKEQEAHPVIVESDAHITSEVSCIELKNLQKFSEILKYVNIYRPSQHPELVHMSHILPLKSSSSPCIRFMSTFFFASCNSVIRHPYGVCKVRP